MFYRNFSGRDNRNLPGVITENLGGKGFVIRDTNENKVVRRHSDHIFRGGNHSPPADIEETIVQQAPQPPAASESQVRAITPATPLPLRSS